MHIHCSVGQGTRLHGGRKPTPPSIPATGPFSADEQFVTPTGSSTGLTYRRPVIVPWSYTPAGTTYWVRTTGNNANPGTQLLPWATFAKALATAGPGDVVYFLPGAYSGAVTATIAGADDTTGRIVFSSAPVSAGGALGTVSLTPTDADIASNPVVAPLFIANGANFLTLNGIEFIGTRGRAGVPSEADFSASCISGGELADRLVVQNCLLRNAIHCGVNMGLNIKLRGNVIYDGGIEGRNHGVYDGLSGGLIDGNLIFNWTGWGLHMYNGADPTQTTGQLLLRNVIIGCGGAALVNGPTNQIYHNVGWKNGTGFTYYRGGCKFNDVRNNIFAQSTGGEDMLLDRAGGADCALYPDQNSDDYNDWYPSGVNTNFATPNLGGCGTVNTVGSHELNANPLFVDPDNGDFRLQAGSPCLGTGVNLGYGTNRGAF